MVTLTVNSQCSTAWCTRGNRSHSCPAALVQELATCLMGTTRTHPNRPAPAACKLFPGCQRPAGCASTAPASRTFTPSYTGVTWDAAAAPAAAAAVAAAAVAAAAMFVSQMVGDLTVGQVLTMLPYANAVSIFTVKGSALAAAIKNGLSAYPNGGRFLQVCSAASQSVL